jgi:hypothetical protein
MSVLSAVRGARARASDVAPPQRILVPLLSKGCGAGGVTPGHATSRVDTGAVRHIGGRKEALNELTLAPSHMTGLTLAPVIAIAAYT